MVDLFWLITVVLLIVVNATALYIAKKRKDTVFKIFIPAWLTLWVLGLVEYANLTAYSYFIYLMITFFLQKLFPKKKKKV